MCPWTDSWDTKRNLVWPNKKVQELVHSTTHYSFSHERQNASGKFKPPKSQLTAAAVLYIRPSLDHNIQKHQSNSTLPANPRLHGCGPQPASSWRRPFWRFTSRPGPPTSCWRPLHGRCLWSTFFWPQHGGIWIRLENLLDHSTEFSCVHTLWMFCLWVLPEFSHSSIYSRWSGWVQCTCSRSKLWIKHWFSGRGGRYSMCKVKSTFELMMAFRFCLTLLFTATA